MCVRVQLNQWLERHQHHEGGGETVSDWIRPWKFEVTCSLSWSVFGGVSWVRLSAPWANICDGVQGLTLVLMIVRNVRDGSK